MLGVGRRILSDGIKIPDGLKLVGWSLVQ